MTDEPFNLRYNLPRTILRVSGCVTESWDWGTNRLVSDADTVTVDLLVAADPLARVTVEIESATWADTNAKIVLTEDARLQGLDYTSSGRRAATYTTLFTGIANGISAALDAAPDEAEASAGSGDSPGTGGAETEGEPKEGKKDDEVAKNVKPSAADGDDPDARLPGDSAKPETSLPSVTSKTGSDAIDAVVPAPEPEQDDQTLEQDPSPAGPNQPDDDTGGEQPPPAEAQEPPRPEGGPKQRARRYSRYERDYPEFARLRSRAMLLAGDLQEEMLDAIAGEGSNFESVQGKVEKRIAALKPILEGLDTHFATWRQQNELRRTVQVQFDLDIWDVPHDREDSPWKQARGRTAIRAALLGELELAGERPSAGQVQTETKATATVGSGLDQSPETLATNQRAGGRSFYFSRDRRDARDAAVAAFDRFGIVVSYRHLYRDGEDRDDNPDTPFDLREEEIPGPLTNQLVFRHPRRVDFRVYRLAPGPDGREVLELETLRHETVVDEASSYDLLPLGAGKDSEHQLGVETHELGTPSTISRLDESEHVARLKAIGEGAEVYAKALASLAPYAVKTVSAASGLGSLAGTRFLATPPERNLVRTGLSQINDLDGDPWSPTQHGGAQHLDDEAVRQLATTPLPSPD